MVCQNHCGVLELQGAITIGVKGVDGILNYVDHDLN